MQPRSVLAASFGLVFVGGIFACQDTFSNALPTYNPDASYGDDTFDATVEDAGPDGDSSAPDSNTSKVDAGDAGDAGDASKAGDAADAGDADRVGDASDRADGD